MPAPGSNVSWTVLALLLLVGAGWYLYEFSSAGWLVWLQP